MRGSLGEKIGEGAFADVHAWAPGQVVKLFKAGVPQRAQPAGGADDPRRLRRRRPGARGVRRGDPGGALRHRAAAPRRTDPAATLAQRRHHLAQAGAILAALCLSVHKTPAPPDVFFLRDLMDGSLRLSGGAVPEHIATGILALIERLPPGDGLCHADLHPGNVIMTADGPRLIDWGGAVRAPAALDLAFCHVILSENRPGSRRRSASGRAPSMRPRSPNTRGWPACPRRR